jgi:predicted Ser/Thr protein kinase
MTDLDSSTTMFPGTDHDREGLRVALQDAAVGEYEVYGELGRGGMATVYLAQDLALDRLVALKVLDPSLTLDPAMVERFKREARTAANLTHPHIIPIYAVRQTERLVYFVMRYVEGRSLDSIIAELGPLPIDMIQTVLYQVAGALAQAHRKGVVHRDIKPANVMIDTDGWAVVTDFGIAKVLEASGLTSTGSAVGTPYYMSPEQYSNVVVTGAADQYSLGVVAWEMLVGRPPFNAVSVMEVMKAHCLDEAPPVEEARPDCPPKLAAMVTRMLAKKPEDRYSSLEEVVDQLGVGPLGLDHPLRLRMITLAKSGAKRPMVPPPPTSPVPASRVLRRQRAGGHWRSLRAAIGGGAFIVMIVVMGLLIDRFRSPATSGGDPEPTPDAGVALPPPVGDAGPAETGLRGPEGTDGNAGSGDSVTSTPPLPAAVPPPAPRAASRTAPIVVPGPVRESTAQDPSSEALSEPPRPQHAYIYLGVPPSFDPPAFVYINGGIEQEPNPGLRWWAVAPGVVRLSIRAEGCQPWEDVRTLAAGDSISIGRRYPSCSNR